MAITLIGSWFSDISIAMADGGGTYDLFAINLQTATKTGVSSTTNLIMNCVFCPGFLLTNFPLQNYNPVYRLTWSYSPIASFPVSASTVAVKSFPGTLTVNAVGGGVGSPAAKIQASINSGTLGVYQVNTRTHFEVWDMGVSI